MFGKEGLSILLGSLAYLYNSEIKETLTLVFDYMMGKITSRLLVNCTGNERLIYAIKEEISDKYQDCVTKFNVTDGVVSPNYKLVNGLLYCIS